MDETPGMTALRVGFSVHAAHGDVAAFEARPIDSLWVGGHVASVNPTPEAMVGLAWLAARAERVRVGTAILLLPLYPPAIVAKQVADLDNATGGRITLGIGIGGEYPAEFRACQVPIGERGPRTDESIALLRKLWSGETVTHEGPYYEMADVRIHPAPTQPGGPPIVVAGRKAPAMRRAALLGDGWMPYLYSPRRYAESAAVIRREAAAAARDLADFEWFAYVFVNVHPDGERARDEAAQFLGGTYQTGDFRAMLERVAAVGTPDEVVATLQSFVDAGARHLILAPASREAPGAMVDRLFGEVLPRLTVP